MSIELLTMFFLWSSILNIGIMIVSFLLFRIAHRYIYTVHGGWYKLSNEQIDLAIYRMMTIYKIFLFMFNIVPYVVLRIIA
ncbi:MAG: hypothetical protein JW814_03460 [Candidatus Krumholzibacteriota bacterium]|nr:hypothetical protein [Candidatus Krumholzibacteriota bacterium]